MTAVVEAVSQADVGRTKFYASLPELRRNSDAGGLQQAAEYVKAAYPNGGLVGFFNATEVTAQRERLVVVSGERIRSYIVRGRGDATYKAGFDHGADLARQALSACRHALAVGRLFAWWVQHVEQSDSATRDGFFAQIEHVLVAEGSTRWGRGA